MKLNSQTNQEIMSQRNQEHMMMPSYPTPHLVMIHTDFTFGLLEDSFNWPSHSADPDKLTQRSAERSIAEKVFDLSRIIQITANDQPEFIGGQATARFGHTQKCKITNDRPLATFFDNCLGPILLLDLLHQLLDWNGLLSFIAQMQTSRMTPMTSPFRNMNLGRTTPDQGILFDGCEVKRSRGSHTVPKRRAVSIQSIGCQPGKRQSAAFYHVFQQFQPDFRLRFENQILWDSAGLPLLDMFFCKPLIGHEQLSFDQAISFATGVAQIHSDLPIRDLSHRAAILCSHAYRFSALFDRTRFIDQSHSILFPQSLSDQALMDREHWFCFPLALPNKILQAAYFLFLSQCHLFNVLACGIPQQAMHIGQAFLDLLHSLKGSFEQLHIFLQFTQKQFDIFRGQGAFGCRAGFNFNSTSLHPAFATQLLGSTRQLLSTRFGYNFSRHGVLPLLFTGQ